MAAEQPISEQYADEQWRPVVGHEGLYEVSDWGRVKSLRRTLPHPVSKTKTYPERILKACPTNKQGHLVVQLGKHNKQYVHRLVLLAFVGPPAPGQEACHWDDDTSNNHLSNLRWGTRQANMIDRSRNGGCLNKNKTHCKYGHEFTPENTRITKEGGRVCRTCAKRRMIEYHERHSRPAA